MDKKIFTGLINEIIEEYAYGDLIPHEYLKEAFLIKPLIYQDFPSQHEYDKTMVLQQFEYMSMIEKLRDEILEGEKLYLKNLRGEGYTLLNPSEQSEFGETKTLKDIKKAINDGMNIILNIRYNSLTETERKKNADALAKISFIKNMVKVKL